MRGGGIDILAARDSTGIVYKDNQVFLPRDTLFQLENSMRTYCGIRIAEDLYNFEIADSTYITSISGEILKIYERFSTPDSKYPTDIYLRGPRASYWEREAVSKNTFHYTFTITDRLLNED